VRLDGLDGLDASGPYLVGHCVPAAIQTSKACAAWPCSIPTRVTRCRPSAIIIVVVVVIVIMTIIREVGTSAGFGSSMIYGGLPALPAPPWLAQSRLLQHTSPCAAYPVSRIVVVVVVVVVLPYLISYHDHQTNNHRTYTPPPLPSCQSAPPCTAGRRVDEAESGPSSKFPYPWALLLLLRRAQNASTTLAC